MRSTEITLGPQQIADEQEVSLFVEDIESYETLAGQAELIRQITELSLEPSQDNPEGEPAAWNQLVELAQNKNPDVAQAAYDKLFQELEPKIRGLARSKLRSSTIDLDDACQGAMERIYSALKRGKYNSENKFMAWVATITKNTTYDLLRHSSSAKAQRAGRKLLSLDMVTASHTANDGSAPSLSEKIIAANSTEEEAMAADLSSLSQAIADSGISAERQRMLYLFEVAGLSYAEIASQLGMPSGTVQSGLHRAKRQLKKTIEACPDKYL